MGVPDGILGDTEEDLAGPDPMATQERDRRCLQGSMLCWSLRRQLHCSTAPLISDQAVSTLPLSVAPLLSQKESTLPHTCAGLRKCLSTLLYRPRRFLPGFYQAGSEVTPLLVAGMGVAVWI